MRSIARKQLSQLLLNLKLHALDNRRVRTFCRLLGATHGGPGGSARAAPTSEALFYLHWLPAIVGSDRLHFALDGERCHVPVLDVARAANALVLPAALGATVSEAVDAVLADPHRGITHKLDLDDFLEYVCGLWARADEENRGALLERWRAADANGDGVLTVHSFVALVHAIEPTVSARAALAIYHEAAAESAHLLHDAESDAFAPEAFLHAVAARGLRVAETEASAAEGEEGGAADGPADGVPGAAHSRASAARRTSKLSRAAIGTAASAYAAGEALGAPPSGAGGAGGTPSRRSSALAAGPGGAAAHDRRRSSALTSSGSGAGAAPHGRR